MLTSQQFVPKTFTYIFAETPQQNPLRWTLYYRDTDNLFYPQEHEFRCKDYFNDFVASYHGKECSIYGMKTANVKKNIYGTWVGVTNVTQAFIHNIEKCLNPKLEAETGHKLFPTAVEKVPGKVLFLIPRVLFNSTYTISFLTLMIRACNCAEEKHSWDELVETSLEPLIVNSKWLKEKHFLPPEHLRKYWFWLGDKHNSVKVPVNNYAMSSFVHNNGFFSWINTKGFVPGAQTSTVTASVPTHVPGNSISLPRFVPDADVPIPSF